MKDTDRDGGELPIRNAGPERMPGPVPAEPSAPPSPTLAKDSVRPEAPKPTGGNGESHTQRSAAPKGPVTLRVHGRTDVGLVREHNEDNFIVADLHSGERGTDLFGENRINEVSDRGFLLAVCDGMGGAAAGEVASQMAVDTLYEWLRSDTAPADRDVFARRLVRAVEESGSRIFEAAAENKTHRGMGTTATVAGLVDKVLFVAQVGDSRAYVFRRGDLKLVTKDQSLVNQLIEAGQLTEAEAEAFEHSNIILQALGTSAEVAVDLTFLELRRGDRLLLCSDGLSGLVHTDMMKEVLSSTADLDKCCETLISMANQGGGHDNITVVLAEFDGAGLAEPSENEPVAYQQYPLPPPTPEEQAMMARTEARTRSLRPVVWTPPSGGDPTHASSVTSSRPRRASSVQRLLWLLGAIAFVAAATALLTPMIRKSLFRTPGRKVVLAPKQIPVRVRSDAVDANLFVNGQHRGVFTTAPVELKLPPGAYLFEARSGSSIIASKVITLRAGTPADISLNLPNGSEIAAMDAGVHERANRCENGPCDSKRPPDSENVVLASSVREASRPRVRHRDAGHFVESNREHRPTAGPSQTSQQTAARSDRSSSTEAPRNTTTSLSTRSVSDAGVRRLPSTTTTPSAVQPSVPTSSSSTRTPSVTSPPPNTAPPKNR